MGIKNEVLLKHSNKERLVCHDHQHCLPPPDKPKMKIFKRPNYLAASCKRIPFIHATNTCSDKIKSIPVYPGNVN